MSDLFTLLANSDVYIWGAGIRGVRLGSILEERGINVNAFIDNGKDKQGTEICNKRCVGVDNVSLGKNCCVVVSPKDNTDAIYEQLKKTGIDMNNVYTYETIYKEHYFFPQIEKKDDFRYVHPFNHYESPYPDIREIHRKEAEIFDDKKEVLDIDFNIPRQMELLSRMTKIDSPIWQVKKTPKYRYCYDTNWFCKGSADVLYYMMRILKPNRIIEVGSGFSTAVMLDTNEYFFENEIEINSIEPYPTRLKSLLKENDNIKIKEKFLQDIPLSFFEQLEENDILFIDSSHISKVDSDVNYIMFEILPRLKKGVYIHFHDIFYPFIYPKNYIYEGRAYNEMYVLRAFLMYNKNFSIQFFGEMLARDYPDKLGDNMKDIGGSLWIKKEI